MSFPTLAIVGRPNVGKSALFNRLCKKRISIVDEAEGVTRDRLSAVAEWGGFFFRVIDTGGIDPASTDTYQPHICKQTLEAIEEADTIVMVVDGRVGATKADLHLASIVLKSGKPVCLAVNKIDSPSQELLIHEFHSLGIQKILPISAQHGNNLFELVEKAWKGNKGKKRGTPKPSALKISIVGRPNVGKSTLANALFNEQRCVVSSEPGTTRDAIEIPFTQGGKEWILIDTAGIRRKKAEKNAVEKFASLRTWDAIEQSDVCLLVIDASDGITSQEKKIVTAIEEAGRACIVLLNKWDLVKGFRMEHCLKAIHEACPFLEHCPFLFISAITKRNLEQIFPLLESVAASMQLRIPTGQLNQFLKKALQANHPTMLKGKRLRIYYMTQVKVGPPTFVLFVNHCHLMQETYKRYLTNQFRAHFPFLGTPLRFILKEKMESQRREAQLTLHA